MTVVVLGTVPILRRRRRCSLHGDGHVRRIRDDVVDGRALLRLGDQRLDVLPTRVGIDIVGDLDPLEAVADLVVNCAPSSATKTAINSAQSVVLALADTR